MKTMSLSEELTWRGFVNQTTLQDIAQLDKKPLTFYWGVDPSASSMTIGNMAAAMMVRHFITHGHTAVLLVGGATGLIGDPDGKAQERDLKSVEEINHNKRAIVDQYKLLFEGLDFEVVDNYDWFSKLGYLEFLRTIGKHVPMRQMLGREFVQSRLSEGGAGISYAEFSYSLIQGYDFLHLFKEKGVTLQVCGADQWGNSIAGVDLIRRITGKTAHIWSTPLVINKSTGAKFGKSESGAVWLDPQLTSPFKFYQFWLNVDDEGCEEYLKIFTLLDKPVIEQVMSEFRAEPSARTAQKTLAYEATKLVHGQNTADSVKRASEILFGNGDYASLQSQDFAELSRDLKVVEVRLGARLTEILVSAELAASLGEARRFLEANAVYINGQQIPLEKQTLDSHDVVAGHVVMRRGKNTIALLTVA